MTPTELNQRNEAKIQELAEKLQAECHAMIDKMSKSDDRLLYQDMTNVWIFRKLAELQLQVESLTPASDGR